LHCRPGCGTTTVAATALAWRKAFKRSILGDRAGFYAEQGISVGKADYRIFADSRLVAGGKPAAGVVFFHTKETAMRLYWGIALAAVLAVTPATIASAQIQLNISMAYAWSYDGSGNTTTLQNVAVPGASGSALSQVNLPAGGTGTFVNHVFNVYATVSGLSSDQDLTLAIFGGSLTGGASAVAGTSSYVPNNPVIAPPPMGSPLSSAPPAPAFEGNEANVSGTAVGYGVRVATGTSTGGDQGNTYGDYAAYLQLGENGPFLIGQQTLICNSAGGYSLQFKPNPGYLQVINGNTDGEAANAFAESYPTYTGVGDSVLFAPRPSTDLTWADGTTANWGVADGALNWIQTASPSTQDNFYHLDTVRFTDNAVINRTVTLVGNLNPAAVIVNSGGNYTFTGSGAIVGTGTTLLKQGAGTLTISNTGTNTYTGLTTVQGGSLILSGAGAQNPVLNLGGADLQAGQIVFDYTAGGSATDPVATVRSDLQSGLIHSSTAPSGYTIAYDDNNVTGNGVANGVVLGLALAGDATLDGTVNVADLNKVLSNWGKTNQTWTSGDFNYDGVVNVADLNKVLANWGKSGPPPVLAPMPGAAGPCSAVPEPGTLALLAAGLIGLLAYAWRKRK
jgi:autotransporter-associated beta strand protein